VELGSGSMPHRGKSIAEQHMGRDPKSTAKEENKQNIKPDSLDNKMAFR